MSNSKINISEILQILFMGLSAVAFTFLGIRLLTSAAFEYQSIYTSTILVILISELCVLCVVCAGTCKEVGDKHDC